MLPGKIKKFDLTTLKEVSIQQENTFRDTTFSNSLCDNAVLEAHYNVFFSESDSNPD